MASRPALSRDITPDELMAFAGLIRMLIHTDGQFTAEEQFVVEKVMAELVLRPVAAEGAQPPDAAASDERVDPDPEATWALVNLARVLPSDEAVRTAALKVTAPEVRATFYAALREIAEADSVSDAEWPLLDWLATVWEIDWS